MPTNKLDNVLFSDQPRGELQRLRERAYATLVETEDVQAAIIDLILAGYPRDTARAIVYWVIGRSFSYMAMN